MSADHKKVDFRLLIFGICKELWDEEEQDKVKIVTGVYDDEQRSYTGFLEIANMLLECDLMRFRKGLGLADRQDLQEEIDRYIENNNPPQEVPEPNEGMPARAFSAGYMAGPNDGNIAFSVPKRR